MSKLESTDTPLLSPKNASEEHDEKAKSEEKPIKYQELGVWTTMMEVGASWSIPGRSTFTHGKDMTALFPFFSRFVQECFNAGPWLVTIYIATSFWESTQSAVGLYFSSRLLDLIQQSILSGQADRQALIQAVAFRLAITIVNSIVSQTRQRTKAILASRVRYRFEERLLRANLRLDLPTFEEPETASKITRLISSSDRGGAWGIFEKLLGKLKGIASVISQLGFLVTILRSQPGSAWFALLCLAKSIMEYATYESFWSSASYTWASNTHYRRVSSLLNLGIDTEHRLEIISNGLVGYIQREWNKARSLLRDASDSHPITIIRTQRPFLPIFLDEVADDFPLIYYAYQVALSPASFSLTSVALMQQAASSLAWTISSIVSGQDTIAEQLTDIKTLYETSHIRNNLEDGELPYPQDCTQTSSGMEISFKNVSFAYPNAENVIKDVSFTIQRGQTVIIVGVNGSGKSTLLKLFNRLYDPTAGTVSVDGVPMQSFRAEDLRRASAMLFQKYTHFSLPIRENISMGLPDEDLLPHQEEKNVERVDPVVEAARLGGAEEFIEKQTDGFETVLKPRLKGWSMNNVQRVGDTFKTKMKAINKTAEVSQGQWQRLALSRLFYRAAGKDIKMVAVDEPSASLDPEMEYELFESLKGLSAKQGKTMVFVTHRFGHLTKQADLILVMQNGCLVEQGKHNDLLQLGGEYAKLYKMQADAFLPSDNDK